MVLYRGLRTLACPTNMIALKKNLILIESPKLSNKGDYESVETYSA